ncbi:hypothetical protein WMF37_04990 [Sorangium sp. So ce291]|uniref:hypothetical protein n=1 Tax=Sorangium sp. So ce291 TaxID=3133294 RepID=UPI003F5F1E32
MMKTLTFLHTSPVHIATFDRLLAEMPPTIPAKHAVDESLLRDARASGLTSDVARRIEQAIPSAVAGGAAVVLCTCSTIGGCAERAGQAAGHPVLRVDRAMAERAVAAGGRIVVAATLVALCPDLPVPVFSSPRPGLEAAIRAYRAVVQPS